MKRQIIQIDEEKCTGCGNCITGCPEGALQLIDGKARLVADLYCDGLGACIGHCPAGAIAVEEREAETYSERKVMEGMLKKGSAVIASHLEHLKEHGEMSYYQEAIHFLKEQGMPLPAEPQGHCGCPGSAARMLDTHRPASKQNSEPGTIFSELRQWPVQLALINPAASYFDDTDLLIVADCVSYAFGDFHRHFLQHRTLAILCPKLDQRVDEYVDRLATIFSLHRIRSVTTVRMEVPCCGGINLIVGKALEKSGAGITVEEYVISLGGEIQNDRSFSTARAL